jgi:von Willebrand factor type A domain-containing protein
VNRAKAVWLSLAISMAAVACAGVNPPPGMDGQGGAAGGGGPITGAGGGGGMRMTGGMGGMGVTVGLGGSMCGLQTFNVNRKPVEIFLVMDRSASMEDGADGNTASASNPTKWSQVIPALSATVQQADKTISWGMKAFPEKGGGSCANDTVTPKIDVSITKSNSAALNTAILALVDNGDGTPTGAAMRVATSYLKQLSMTDDARKYILLATDGEPSCAGSVGSLSSDSTAARTDAIAAVTEAAVAGFHTFVVGVATTKANDAATLNALAIAGLEPSPDMRPGATRFFLASNQAQLTTTLESIVNPIASNCVFPLSGPPPVPENIAVKVDGNKTPQDTSHAQGWDYTDPNYTAVQVYGSFCDTIKNNGNMVEIIFGCKGVIIP